MLTMPDKILTPEQRQQNLNAVRHIKKWLKQKEVTQDNVAEALGVTQVMISKWLNGHIALTVKQLLAIEKFLNLETGDLLLDPSLVKEKERYKHILSIAKKMDIKAIDAWIEIGRQLTEHK
ncbi:hypothetical protein COMNV_00739 [Commensalibacter sp. Nvir]|uniref:helix-turn-helix domain-containing protein n=1 Tax=Commensalibacter sp. Nvir TaxID=3069817 RepID=UPI002D3202FF|nr:hypothetical protein COMNV_00739 [Commensalibacter sp. Nvir]